MDIFRGSEAIRKQQISILKEYFINTENFINKNNLCK